MSSLALFADVANRRCLVVGAGPVAARKIDALVRADAPVRVVAPEAVDSVHEHAEAGRIEYQARDFREEDLEGVFLVVVASNDAALNGPDCRRSAGAGSLGQCCPQSRCRGCIAALGDSPGPDSGRDLHRRRFAGARAAVAKSFGEPDSWRIRETGGAGREIPGEVRGENFPNADCADVSGRRS